MLVKAMIPRVLDFAHTHHLRILQAAVSLVLLAGLAYSIILSDAFRYPDEQDYYKLAVNLATKGSFSYDGLHPTASRPPGYPLVLSVFLYFGADVLFVRYLNFVFLSGCIFLLYKLLSDGGDYTAAAFAAVLTLSYPVLFYTAGTLYPQILSSFLFLLFVYLVFKTGAQSAIRALVAGIVMGFLILVMPTFIPVLGVVLLVMFSRLRAKGSLLILTSAVVIVGLWTFRNWQEFHTFVPISTNSGVNLLLRVYRGAANSGSNVDAPQPVIPASAVTEADLDALYRSVAIRSIMNDPTSAISRYSLNLLNYFNFRNDMVTKSESAAWKDLLMLFTYGPLLLLFLIRLCLFNRFPLTKIEMLFAIVYLSNAFIQAIFFTRVRYRLPFDLLLIGSVAVYLSMVLGRFITHHGVERYAESRNELRAPS